MTTTVHPQATRRVPLSFDAQGDPTYATVCSPKSFAMRALAVVPPRHVIPVIFVPGIMGTNIRATKAKDPKQSPAWEPPNGLLPGVGQWYERGQQIPALRQKQMDPATTEVDPTGHISVPDTVYTLTEEEARRRGWGELHSDSYAQVLTGLEEALNEQYLEPGTKDAVVMPVWKLAQSLKKMSKGGEEIDVLTAWNPVKGDTPALTADEFERLDDYYYPVWACGYNWLESNEKSAARLVKKIEEILAWYSKTKYFIPEGRVILVTHSMGGLVARRAAQLAEDKILGVVHGVLPVGGAPVVYRRFRAGTEVAGIFDIAGAAVATIIGWDAADITCVMANAPGPLELLPTKHYPPGWLKVAREVGTQHESLFELPVADPYAEIYAKTTQEVWWGMIDETLIDPAQLHESNGVPPFEAYQLALTQARNFHNQVNLYCHPNTYAHYGADAKQISFGSVHWTTHDAIPDAAKAGLIGLPSGEWNKLGKASLTMGDKSVRFKLANKAKPTSDADPDAGDGTVPRASGALISDGATHVFRMKGVEHASSYKEAHVLDNVLYCLGKIIQTAIPAKDLPQSKGETCAPTDSSNESSTDSPKASDSAPQPASVSAP